MKKLEKLILQDFPKICEKEQQSMIGGSGGFVMAPDGNVYYCPGEAIVYGGPGGAAERAIMEIGTCEINGTTNTSQIMSYFDSCAGSYSTSDGWCSAFVNSMFQASGLQGTDSARASSWLDWGTSTSNPQVGDVAVYSNGGHCGIVTSIENGVVMVTSGNSGAEDCVRTGSYGDWVFRTGGN